MSGSHCWWQVVGDDRGGAPPWRGAPVSVLSGFPFRAPGPLPCTVLTTLPLLLAEAAGSAAPRVGPPALADMAALICPILGHVLGAIPVGLLLGYAVKGIDLRQHGSGNIGATNAARVLGWKWGMLALLLDALKGMLPVLLARLWTAGSPNSLHIQVVTGILAILGHMFPVWLKFKGGKGVATGLGVALVLSPISSLWALGAYLLGFGITRVSSVGSLIAAVTFPAAEWIRTGHGMFSAEHWSLGVFSLAIPALIIVRHRSNIARLLQGKERALAPPESKEPTPPQ